MPIRVIDLGGLIFFLNLILTILVIVWGRRRPARSTVLWVMLVSVFPIIGFIAYLLVGASRNKEDMFILKESQDKALNKMINSQMKRLQRGKLFFPEYDDYNELVALNLKLDNALLTDKNTCDLFFDGKDKFDFLFRDIQEAKSTIDIQYYIVKRDKLGLSLLNLLKQAAKRGVKVRLLVDAVGGRTLYDKDIRGLREAGCQVAVFFPSLFKHLNPRLNYRNHRKLVIIDDHIGYIGGFNVGDEYLGKVRKYGYWRDTHVRIDGSGTADLKVRFLQDWLYASGDDPEKEPEISMQPNPEGDVQMQLVTSGPDTKYHNIKYAMLKMIHSANESIYIQTPYLIPDTAFMDALIVALKQGVEVNIMIPDHPDHPIVYWATTSYAGELIAHGAKIYRYEKGFLHAKVVMIDHLISMVGSANIDERSFSLNFEASEIIYSKEVSEKLHAQFALDCENSTLLTPERYANRPLLQRMKEPFARLFSPLL